MKVGNRGRRLERKRLNMNQQAEARAVGQRLAIGHCYRCAMAGRRENGERVAATTKRDEKPVCDWHAEEHDRATRYL